MQPEEPQLCKELKNLLSFISAYKGHQNKKVARNTELFLKSYIKLQKVVAKLLTLNQNPSPSLIKKDVGKVYNKAKSVWQSMEKLIEKDYKKMAKNKEQKMLINKNELKKVMENNQEIAFSLANISAIYKGKIGS